MVDLERLNQVVKESGMTLKSISEKAGIPGYTLYRKMKGQGEFTASDIVGLTRALRLKVSERNDIFLRDNVN